MKDFAPVVWVVRVPNVQVVNPAVPAKALKELVARAKARPRQLNYGSGVTAARPTWRPNTSKLQTGASLLHQTGL